MDDIERPFSELEPKPFRRRQAVTFLGSALMLFAGSSYWMVNQSLAKAPSSAAIELSSKEQVVVEVYGMAGCPFTRAFLEGPLTEALTIVPAYIDLRFHPFGNTYYVTKKCGGNASGQLYASYNKNYDSVVRKCWDKMCGAAASEPAEDCFKGELVTQHGATDGMVTTSWACAKDLAAGDASFYWPFITCTAFRFLGITTPKDFADTVRSCGQQSGFPSSALLECAQGPHGRQLLNMEGRATKVIPGAPYVLVDGKNLEDTNCVACGDGILQKLCEALRLRKLPESRVCQGIFGEI